ncbi:MAG: tRNA (adenosine(37)-N6)-threonylcarbamoyltransferase complex ATPase subunit type 1 TsaE [Desulfurivibrio sp.]|nr:tRNA (adenosine(37)-N6)-threonylcarbamoyltransferase complex ATPase subunit type 1 TsaE [Desulfurivibrio sp.]
MKQPVTSAVTPTAQRETTAGLATLNALGHRLGEITLPGDVILLHGPLGGGKTTLAQAIAAGLEVPPNEPVTSPTFGIIHEYRGRLPLYHLDLYRLGGEEEELLELGVEDYLYGAGVCVVEWPERLGELRPAKRLEISLEFAAADHRHLKLTAHGGDWPERLERLWQPAP